MSKKNVSSFPAWKTKISSEPLLEPLPTPLSTPIQSSKRPETTLLLVYWLSKIFGIAPLSYDGTTEKLVRSRANVFYSALFMCFSFALLIFLTQSVAQTTLNEGKFISGLEPVLLAALNTLQMVTAIFRSSDVMDTLSMLWGLDVELTPARGGPVLFISLIPTFLTIFASLADMITSFLEEFEDAYYDTLVYTSYYVSTIAGALVEAQFCVACLALRFWVWNTNLRIKSLRKNGVGAMYRLEALRLTHAKLISASKELDATFAPQLLLGCTLSFVGTVLNAYFSVNGFYQGGREQDEANEVLQNVQWLFVVMYLSRIFLLCFSTSRLVTELKQTGWQLCILGDQRLATEIKAEIELFQRQVIAAQVDFSAWGIIPLDFSLLFAIVSTTTSYLLILIQYRPK
ncbi:uncharacterized protein LOC132197848 [Neocloeon triangulifer]|uniref:uncharacterized protein LOC132197848 n=1 Tax=Neocloeon triangulifer TaxID=2078957 RepID=UPI00286ECE1C|nr:uncharacterized protein LOC132197848 [Neocloeon triangulifer]XP_059477409.1 uncharacterized protein LOC132197848 [Neocloeon triangulifer]